MQSRDEIERAIDLRVTERSFSDRELDEECRMLVRDSIEQVEPFMDREALSWYYTGKFPVASGIILARMQDFRTERLVQYGFEGEQIVLDLTLKGFSTSWTRLPNYLSMIVLGFHENNGKRDTARAARYLYRDANRKPLEEIVSGRTEFLNNNMRSILNCGRMAPSSFNRQPWSFEILGEREVAIHGWKKIPLIYEEVISIDLGVVLSHLYLMAKSLTGRANLVAKSERTYLLSWT